MHTRYACSINVPFVIVAILAIAITLVVVVVIGLVLVVLVVTIIAVAVAIIGIVATALLRVRHAEVNCKKLLWQIRNWSRWWFAVMGAHLKAVTFAVEQGMG